jgi:murein DD-endopeptidase MepM/ murein hydrolase activator NlpD
MYGKTTDKWDVRCEGCGGYSGVDIRVPGGTPVKAIASGIVHYSGYNPEWGKLVVIKHEVEGISEPVWSIYAHLSSRYVKKYDQITIASQKIDISGNTGSGSKGDHLHFEIDKGSSFIKPLA